MTLIFFKCKFYNNTIDGSLVLVTAYHFKVNSAAHRDVRFTNITFNICSFHRNSGTVLNLINHNQLKLSVSFVYIGVDLNNWLSCI